jgi:hypothetical protein
MHTHVHPLSSWFLLSVGALRWNWGWGACRLVLILQGASATSQSPSVLLGLAFCARGHSVPAEKLL